VSYTEGIIAMTYAANSAYPARPIRLIVPFAPGGSTDVVARAIAVPLADALQQQVVVDNRPAAGGTIGAELTARASADGYTLLMGSSGTLAINPSLYPKLAYHPVKDFAPVIHIGSSPHLVAVHPSLAVNSVKEFIALAKSQPRKFNYGAAPGTASHLATELFRHMAGIEIVHIPYKGAALGTTDLIAGQIQLRFGSVPSTMPFVRSAKIKALAVTSSTRLTQFPEIPTVAESGLKGYEASVFFGVVAPARTSREIVQRLNREIAAVMQQPRYRELMRANDFEPVAASPESFAKLIAAETVKWAEVVRASGARAD
jgi:tripartite-type tricarboxylate transporter receptor subunit TctC